MCFALVVPFLLPSWAAAAGVSKNPAEAPNGAYSLDPAHSVILFSIQHMGLTDYYGRFDDMSGTLNFDGNQPERSQVSVTVDMDSLDTPSPRLNKTLEGKDVFDVADFPEATFKSTSVTRLGDDHGRITGTLTIRNVTKPVTLDTVFIGTTRNALDDSPELGFRATTTIKRSDFGLTGMVWEPLVSDDITLTIEAAFQQESQ